MKSSVENLIHENVIIGDGCQIDNNVEIGRPPRGKKDGELVTKIGKNCTIRSGTIIYAGTNIGDNFQTGHYAIIRENNIIGNNCSLGIRSELAPGNTIGNHVRIHSSCFLEKTTIESDVIIAPGVKFADDFSLNHASINDPCLVGATVKKGARIGMGAILLPHVIIGEQAVVGAGSVVTHNVEPMTIVVGNPARFLKSTREVICPICKKDQYPLEKE